MSMIIKLYNVRKQKCISHGVVKIIRASLFVFSHFTALSVQNQPNATHYSTTVPLAGVQTTASSDVKGLFIMQIRRKRF
jgi:hypothetical protein